MTDRRSGLQRVEEQTMRRLLVLAAVSLFTCLGLYLRCTYARSSSPYIDEYTTMWVAQRTVQYGYPVFPTGALYAQGVLFTYLDAAVFYLFGFSEWIARLPSLVLSTGCIPLSYWVGRRIFSHREGLLTCALVALDPQSIGWGGRARSYALFVFLVVLVVYFSYLGVVRRDKAGYRRLALLLFLAAVFAHNEAILMYPALLAVALLWRGWRWLLHWDVLAENIVTIGGMGLSFYLYRLMQPMGWSEVGEGRGEVALSLDIVRAWDRLKPFFLGPDQLPFVGLLTFLLLVGVAYLLVRCWRKGRRQLFDPTGRDTGLLFLNVLFVLVVLEMFLFVSERRLGARYLFMLGPVFFLISSAVFFRSVEFVSTLLTRRNFAFVLLGRHPLRARFFLTGAILVLVAAFSLPASLEAAHRQELQYDVAFRYVREHMQESDKVMTFATSPCVLSLGRCDYVAVEKDFHAYATQRGDHWVEAWAGAPILFTDSALEEAIQKADRMWFVIDQMRFRTRYSTRFIQYVWDNMVLAAREDGVFVFRAQNPPPPPPTLQCAVHLNLGDEVGLRGYALNGDDFKPGDRIRLLLRWEGLTHMLKNYSVFVHLVDASGFMWAQNDGAALEGLYPTTYWVEGEVISDMREINLPVDIPSGRYRLEVGVYNPQTLERLGVMDEAGNYLGDSIILDYVQASEKPHEGFAPQHLVDASLGNKVTLWGYDVETTAARPGEKVRLVLYWRASELEEDYTVFVHLVDDTGRIWGQADSQPENGFYPTSYWDIGEVVRDEYEIMVDPEAPPGIYAIEVGLYLLSTRERLPYVDEEGQALGDAMVLQEIHVRR